ncbi:MAG: glycosyltransferase [Alcanivorax sp.]|nr:glycosyltransferase [Alcanivorax sp.]
MNVLQICNHYEAPFLDVTRQYAALFQGKNASVTTVFLRGEYSRDVECAEIGDNVIFLNLTKKQVRGMKIEAIKRIKELNAKNEFDVCIAHRYHPIKIAIKSGDYPVFAVHHRYGTYSRWERRFFINKHKKRLWLLNVSRSVRDETRSVLSSWPEEKIQALYNHVDMNVLQKGLRERDEARHLLGMDEDIFVFSNVGRLHKDKDQETLIRAFAKALPFFERDAKLYIYGKGPLKVYLEKLSDELGVSGKVLFPGFVKDLSSLFKAFDSFVLSSDHEPFGMVLLEAMVAGVPVICSDCGGGREVIGDSGLLFPLGDSDELSSRMIDMAALSMDELDQCRARQRKRVVENFTDQVIQGEFWSRFGYIFSDLKD